MRSYLWGHRGTLTAGALLLLGASLVSLLPPLVVGRAIDDVTRGGAWGSLWQAAAAIVALSAIGGVMNYGARQCLVGVSRDVEYELRRDFFAHLLRQPMSYFHQRRVGDLISLATNDLTAVRMMTGPAIMQSLNTAFLFVGNVAVMVRLSPRLTLLALCALPLTSLTARYFGQHIHQRFQAVQEELATLSSRIQETLSGIRVVRAYQQEGAEQGAFDRQNEQVLSSNRSIIGVQAFFQPLLAALTAVGAALVLWVGGLEVIHAHMSLGTLVQFNLYVARLAWPMRALGWVVNQLQRASASLTRLEAELTVEPAIRDGEGFDAEVPQKAGLAWRNVTVTLPQRGAVLRGVSLEVQPGETLGLVGPTGCGKTMLLNTLPRLLDVTEGEVEVGGVDVRRYRLADLRSRLACVAQDSFLFSRTVADNIAFSAPAAADDGIHAAALQAGLEPDLAVLVDGLKTLVGERGVTLSGGQKQRVALARALLRDAEILLLDDVFSSVDSHTEELILEALTRARQGRTTVVVSHRLAALRHAHRIAVMDAGRIVAVGTHDELLEKSPLYAGLWEQQRLRAYPEADRV